MNHDGIARIPAMCVPPPRDPNITGYSYDAVASKINGSIYSIRFRITNHDTDPQSSETITFDYDINNDTETSIAIEIIDECRLPKTDVECIANTIKRHRDLCF